MEELAKIGSEQEEEELTASRSDTLHTICYTSGTTGNPKGVMIGHQQIIAVANNCINVGDPKLKK